MIAILSQWFLSLYSEYMSHISMFLISNHYLSIQTNLSHSSQTGGKGSKDCAGFLCFVSSETILGSLLKTQEASHDWNTCI